MEEPVVHINGNNYRLLLSTRATKDIAARYGGLSNLGDKLLKAENFEMAIDELVWLICELANQHLLLRSIQTKTDIPLLTEDYIELTTTPAELSSFKDAIILAISEGMNKSIETENVSKNRNAG